MSGSFSWREGKGRFKRNRAFVVYADGLLERSYLLRRSLGIRSRLGCKCRHVANVLDLQPMTDSFARSCGIEPSVRCEMSTSGSFTQRLISRIFRDMSVWDRGRRPANPYAHMSHNQSLEPKDTSLVSQAPRCQDRDIAPEQSERLSYSLARQLRG